MKQFIYILTDNNREAFKIGFTDDLNYTIHYYKDRKAMSLNSHKEATRLVYIEEVETEQAVTRLQEIDRYTRPQKERLIRNDNRNWLDLSLRIDTQSHSSAYSRLYYAS